MITTETQKQKTAKSAVLTNVNNGIKNVTFTKDFGLENANVEARSLIVREKAGINCRTELLEKDETAVWGVDHQFNLAHYIGFLKDVTRKGDSE